MLVRRHIRVEIGARSIDNHLAQKASVGKLMKRVIDRRQGDGDAFPKRLIMKHFGPQVAISTVKQEVTQCQALPRGTQFRFFERR